MKPKDRDELEASSTDVSLPQQPVAQPAPGPSAEPAQLSLDALREKHKIEEWKHAAAIAKRGWLPNQDVSDSDYLAAVNEAQNEEIR